MFSDHVTSHAFVLANGNRHIIRLLINPAMNDAKSKCNWTGDSSLACHWISVGVRSIPTDRARKLRVRERPQQASDWMLIGLTASWAGPYDLGDHMFGLEARRTAYPFDVHIDCNPERICAAATAAQRQRTGRTGRFHKGIERLNAPDARAEPLQHAIDLIGRHRRTERSRLPGDGIGAERRLACAKNRKDDGFQQCRRALSVVVRRVGAARPVFRRPTRPIIRQSRGACAN